MQVAILPMQNTVLVTNVVLARFRIVQTLFEKASDPGCESVHGRRIHRSWEGHIPPTFFTPWGQGGT